MCCREERILGSRSNTGKTRKQVKAGGFRESDNAGELSGSTIDLGGRRSRGKKTTLKN